MLEANISTEKILLGAKLSCYSKNLTLISQTALQRATNWTVPLLHFSQEFYTEIFFFFSFLFCQVRVQTKRGILDQVHVPVAFVLHCDLPKNLCQGEELTANQLCCLRLGLQATGQRSTGWTCQLCYFAQTKPTKYKCKSKHSHIISVH